MSSDVQPLDLAALADDDRLRNRVDLVPPTDATVAVEGDLDIPAAPLQKLADDRRGLLLIDGDQHHLVPRERLRGAHDPWHGSHARTAPRGPEIDDHDLARVVPETELPPAEQLGVDAPGGLPDEWGVETGGGRTTPGRRRRRELRLLRRNQLPVRVREASISPLEAEVELVNMVERDTA